MPPGAVAAPLEEFSPREVEGLFSEVRLLRQGGTNPIPDQNCCLTGMEVCLPRVLEGPVQGTRLPIRRDQKSEPEEALSGKSLYTNQRNRLLILVSLLAVAGLCRFSPPASRVCCGALETIRGGWFAGPCPASEP